MDDFLSTLLSCYVIPTIDKPMRVYRSSATLINNIFVNNPEQVSLSGNIISDISNHFSQFCLIKSTSNLSKKKKKCAIFLTFLQRVLEMIFVKFHGIL